MDVKPLLAADLVSSRDHTFGAGRDAKIGRKGRLIEPASHRPERPARKSEPYTGPLPTIAETRSHGVVAYHIQCAGPNCWNEKRFTFDELGLPNDAVFVHIPRLRRFQCRRCGCRSVRVSADWRDHKAHGNGKPTERQIARPRPSPDGGMQAGED